MFIEKKIIIRKRSDSPSFEIVYPEGGCPATFDSWAKLTSWLWNHFYEDIRKAEAREILGKEGEEISVYLLRLLLEEVKKLKEG